MNVLSAAPLPRTYGAPQSAAAPPAASGSSSDAYLPQDLGFLPRLCVKVGDGLARLGGGGCAGVGFVLGLPAMALMPSVTLPLVTAGLGYLSGWDARGARDAFQGGPTSPEWLKRREQRNGPPRAVTTADAGAHLLVAGTFLLGSGLGYLATHSPAGFLVGGILPTMLMAIASGRAAGQAERALITQRYGAQHV